VSFDNERRQHRRYPLRLAIKLHREHEVLDADIINASNNGCLLLSRHPLEPGQQIEASIPELMIPRTWLHIVRCQATPLGYMIAACFEEAMSDDAPMTWSSNEKQSKPVNRRLLN